MAEKTVSARIVVDSSQASAALKSFGSEARINFDLLTRSSERATQSLAGSGGALNDFSRNARNAFGQLGYQVQDFVVQVQSGTNVLQAFIQQGSQLAGAFGPIPALIAGAAAAVVGIGASFLGFNKETGKSPDILAAFIKQLEEAGKTAETVAGQIDGLTEAQRRLAGQKAGTELETTLKEVQGATSNVGGAFNLQLQKAELSTLVQLPPAQALDQQGRLAVQRAGKVADLEGALNAAVSAGNTAEVQRLIADANLGGTPEAEALINLAGRIAGQKVVKEQSEELALTINAPGQATSGGGLSAFGSDLSDQSAPVPVARDEKALDALHEEADRKRQAEADRRARQAEAERQRDQERSQRQADQAKRILAAAEQEAAGAEKLAAAKRVELEATRSLNGANDNAVDVSQRVQREIESERRVRAAAKDLTAAQLEVFKQEEQRRLVAIQQTDELTQAIKAQNKANQDRIADAKLIESLEIKASKVTDQRQAYVDQQVAQASETASEQTKQQIADAAAAAYDNEQLRKQTEDFASQQAEILTKPWEDLAATIARVTGDAFDEILRTGKLTIDSLASSLSDGLRGIVSQTLGTLVTQPLQQGVASLATALNGALAPGGQGLTAGLQQWATANPGTAALGAGALGLTAGNAITAATGGSQVGSTIGGLIGGGAGFLVGGPIGAGVGSFLGSTVGGLFGGSEQNLGNDRAALEYYTNVGTTYQDKSSSPENRRVVNSFTDQVDSLVEGLNALGGSVNTVSLKFAAGNKSGLEFQGKEYSTQEALMQAVIRFIGGQTSGLDERQQQVLANTKGRSVQEVFSDLDFAKQFGRIVDDTSGVARALQDLDEQFAMLEQRAKSLGLSTDGLSDAYDRQRQEIVTSVEREISAFTQDNQFLRAFDDLTERFEDLKQAAWDVGRGVEDLEQAYEDQLVALERTAEAQVESTEQQYNAQVRSLTGLFDSLLQPITQALSPFGISNGIAAPTATVSGGLDQFREMLAQAREGDVSAISGLVGLGQQTIGAARQYGASGQDFQAVFKEINSGLIEIQGKLQDKQIEALQDLGDIGRETVDELVRLRRDGIETLRDQLEQLRLEVRQLSDRRAA